MQRASRTKEQSKCHSQRCRQLQRAPGRIWRAEGGHVRAQCLRTSASGCHSSKEVQRSFLCQGPIAIALSWYSRGIRPWTRMLTNPWRGRSVEATVPLSHLTRIAWPNRRRPLWGRHLTVIRSWPLAESALPRSRATCHDAGARPRGCGGAPSSSGAATADRSVRLVFRSPRLQTEATLLRGAMASLPQHPRRLILQVISAASTGGARSTKAPPWARLTRGGLSHGQVCHVSPPWARLTRGA